MRSLLALSSCVLLASLWLSAQVQPPPEGAPKRIDARVEIAVGDGHPQDSARADALDMRKDIQFSTKVTAATFDEAAARLAHPRTEHFAPLFVTLGATAGTVDEQRSVIDGFWYGLSKRSFQFG